MRIYRNNYTADTCDGGSSYHRSKAEAVAAFTEQQEDENTYDERAQPVDIPCTAAGLLAALNKYSSHNNNG